MNGGASNSSPNVHNCCCMDHDTEYFRRRAAEARAAAASKKDDGDSVEIAGDLALAYSALARRRAAQAEPPAIPLDEPA
jgi:hypothetical protein